MKIKNALLFLVLAIWTNSCISQSESSEGKEENAMEFAPDYRLDKIYYGARLILSYDKGSNSFKGTVENTTKKSLDRVRVEVHLSNGNELGPTTPTNLDPKEKIEIELKATAKGFDGWTAHAEVGNMELGHGEGGEEGGEHGREGRGEHGGESKERGEHGGDREGRGEHGGEREEASEGEEGHEDGEGPGDGAESRDNNRSPITPIGESYKGVILGLEVNVTLDGNTNILEGTIKNVSSEKIRFIQNEPHLILGKRTVAELGPEKLGDLNPGETVRTSININNDPKFKKKTNVRFDGYFIHIEVGETGYKTHESGGGEEEQGEEEGHEGKVGGE